jgi:hypothetical protein
MMSYFYDLISDKFNTFILCSEDFDINFNEKNSIINFKSLNEFCRINTLYKRYQQKLNIFNNDNFKNILEFIINNTKIEFEYINQYILMFLSYIEAYEYILNRIRPKIIFVECYYSLSNLALIHVAHIYKIKIVDIQHAIQVDTHYMYTNFYNHPKEGYTMLPNYFWVWDNKSLKQIREWSQKTSKHKAILGGNIYTTFFKNIPKNNLNIYPSGKINILLALDTNKNYVDYIKEVILEDKNYIWHLRDHPAHNYNLIKEKEFDKIEGENIEFYYSNKVKLIEYLHNVDVTITFGSTISFIGKELYKIPSIIISNDFSLKDQDGIFYARSKNEFVDKINYICANLKKIRKNIKIENTVKSKVSINECVTYLINI